MNKIELEQNYINDYIKTSLSELATTIMNIENARYHHNSSYKFASSILQYGILSLDELSKKGINKYSSEFLSLMSDTDSHANGNNCVSLSVAGLTDLYSYEHEYNPFKEDMVDFLITTNIQAMRTTTHYGNEYVANRIENNQIKSLDIRLLKYIEQLKKGTNENFTINKLIDKYNSLIEIAVILKQLQLNIPIREMSENKKLVLDVDKLLDAPKILLKKK